MVMRGFKSIFKNFGTDVELENILFKFSKISKLTVFSSVVEISPVENFRVHVHHELFYLLR